MPSLYYIYRQCQPPYFRKKQNGCKLLCSKALRRAGPARAALSRYLIRVYGYNTIA